MSGPEPIGVVSVTKSVFCSLFVAIPFGTRMSAREITGTSDWEVGSKRHTASTRTGEGPPS